MTERHEIRRMDRHREFPINTCPASRHAAFIARGLAASDPFVIDRHEYPHAGGSIASTVASLWQARKMLHKLGYHHRNGRWVQNKED